MTPDKPEKEITIICVSYQRYKQIHVLIHCLLCQTLQNWRLLIIHDGKDEKMRREVQGYIDEYSNISYTETDKRYNDYGHSLREIGINTTQTPFLMMTNDDNYYAPKFLEFMFDAIKQLNLDFVLCNMVSSHEFRFSGEPSHDVYTNVTRAPDGTYTQAPYNVIHSIPQKHCVDIGNFIIKTSLAKAVGFRDKSFAGDGTFVEDVVRQNTGQVNLGKVHKVLFVHN